MRRMILVLTGGAVALVGCMALSPGPEIRPASTMGDGERREAYACASQATAAGAAAQGPNLVWQMAAQRQTEYRVYVLCMRGKGYEPTY